MIFDPKTGKARMTASEKAVLRKAAAGNGFAINDVNTVSKGLDASIKALPIGVAEDILHFLETRESQLTACPTAAEFEKRLEQLSRA